MGQLVANRLVGKIVHGDDDGVGVQECERAIGVAHYPANLAMRGEQKDRGRAPQRCAEPVGKAIELSLATPQDARHLHGAQAGVVVQYERAAMRRVEPANVSYEPPNPAMPLPDDETECASQDNTGPSQR